METGKLSQFVPQTIFAHVNRHKRMGTRTQRLLHPYGPPATTDQEMAVLLKQTFQSFYRTDKGSSSTFHPRTEIRTANPHITESETQEALEALNSNTGTDPESLHSLYTLPPHLYPLPPNLLDP